MSKGIIIGGIVLLIVIIGVVIYFTMGVDKTTPTSLGPTSPGPTALGPTAPVAPLVVPYIIEDESQLSEYNAGIVELGGSNSIEDCRKLAHDTDYAAFGFRKAVKNCWAIVDGEATVSKIVPSAEHAVGCVTRGEDINNGCKTTKTNVIRARHYNGFISHEDITCDSIDSCRTAAIAKGANHFGWRETGGNGWVVTDPAISSTTPEFMINNTIGCTDPIKRPPNC
jgi:hypothetical protein